MLKDYYSKNLDEDETLIEIVRRHPITMTGSFIMVGILVILDFFFLTWLFSQGLWGIILFALALLFSFFMGFRTWVVWSKNAFIITTKRVVDIDQHGFFHKVVSECNYDKIQDVSFTVRGIWATLFHFGGIQIQTAGNVANLELKYLKNPNRIQELIMDQQRERLSNPKEGEITKEELLEAIHKVKRGVDEETIKKLFKE